MARVFKRSTPAATMMNSRCAWHVADDTYEVIARDGVTRHRVQVVGGVPLCPCEAHRWGNACWHAAIVLRRCLRERHADVLALLGNAVRRAA